MQRKRVNDVVEMISELCDPVEPLLPSPPANLLQPTAADTPANADATPNTNTAAMTSEKSARENVVLSKVDERNIRLKVSQYRTCKLYSALFSLFAQLFFDFATVGVSSTPFTRFSDSVRSHLMVDLVI